MIVSGYFDRVVGLFECDTAGSGIGQGQKERVAAGFGKFVFIMRMCQRKGRTDSCRKASHVISRNLDFWRVRSVEIESQRSPFIVGRHPDARYGPGPLFIEEHLFDTAANRVEPFESGSVVVGEPAGFMRVNGTAVVTADLRRTVIHGRITGHCVV